MKVLVLGAAGQLGQDIVKVIREEGGECLTPSHNCLSLDLLQLNLGERLWEYFRDNKPIDWVINCAAMHDINLCETKEDEAVWINGMAEFFISRQCDYYHINHIYISTNYVFDGKTTRFYTTEDVPHPLQTYGRSKLIGELLCTGHIVRTSGLFGIHPPRGKEMNFVDRVVMALDKDQSMNIKDYEYISPTYTVDLAKSIYNNIMTNDKIPHFPPPRMSHMVNGGWFTWYSLAKTIGHLYGKPLNNIKPVSMYQYEEVERPRGAMMASTFQLPTTIDALKRYLKEKYGISRS